MTVWERKKDDLEKLLSFYRKNNSAPLYVSTFMTEAELSKVTRPVDGKWIYDGFNLLPGTR